MQVIAAVATLLLSLMYANLGHSQEFDAASVRLVDNKVVRGVTGRSTGGPGTSDPSRMTFTQVPLISLLARAWGFDQSRIAGPPWLGARADLYTVVVTMPPATTEVQFQLMLQNLLSQRFRLQAHHEMRNYPASYRLTIAPSGPKLKVSKDTDPGETQGGITGDVDADGFPILPPGHHIMSHLRGHGEYLRAQEFTIPEFASGKLPTLVRQPGGPLVHIVDETGLSGKYDFTLKFYSNAIDLIVLTPTVRAQLERAGRLSTDDLGDNGSFGLQDIFKSIETQLGLRLVKSKDLSMDTLVIDHLEKIPAEN